MIEDCRTTSPFAKIAHILVNSTTKCGCMYMLRAMNRKGEIACRAVTLGQRCALEREIVLSCSQRHISNAQGFVCEVCVPTEEHHLTCRLYSLLQRALSMQLCVCGHFESCNVYLKLTTRFYCFVLFLRALRSG